ncbi:MAG TPA: DUF3048 domain-containing protein [Anaerolineaceae bacterium]|nr:DUF3048 domain-containing protein [Anaerolineaceae bacterium]
MPKLWKILGLLLAVTLLAGCGSLSPLPTVIPTSTLPATATPFQPAPPTATAAEPTAVPTPTLAPTPVYPGYGPNNFPAEINPLTGLAPQDANLLNRRPIIIKVQNLPRYDRPQYGLSLADLVFEYYTEEGSTRFAALYYGQDATQVMPIRSARHHDIHLIRAYKAVFLFGYADPRVYERLISAEFYQRLLLESDRAYPALTRFGPSNFLMANTTEVQAVCARNGIDNSRQNLDGMRFELAAPGGGTPATQVDVHFSAAIYNRWTYDAASGRYQRASDTQNAADAASEVYAPLTDALTGAPIAADNVVILFVPHEDREPNPEVEMPEAVLLGQGPAWITRDGQIYPVTWARPSESSILTLVDASGQPFPFKPGQTWIEVLTASSKHEASGSAVRFTFWREW